MDRCSLQPGVYRMESASALRKLVLAAGIGACVAAAAPAAADAPTPVSTSGKPTYGAWSGKHAQVLEDVSAGRPLVVEVFVPLCSDKRGGPCGKHDGAGEPDNLEDNLYWGAIWGAHRYLKRGWLGWTEVQQSGREDFALQRAVFTRKVSGAKWGSETSVEQVVVLHAVHGDSNEDALDRFRKRAESGGTVRFQDASGVREERVHAVGFMGRNPLLKNGVVPKKVDLPGASASSGAIASFSIAAHSRETLAPWLAETGSRALILARGASASEAYALESVLKGIGDNDATWTIEKRTIASYAKHQRLTENVAKLHFARALPKHLFSPPPSG